MRHKFRSCGSHRKIFFELCAKSQCIWKNKQKTKYFFINLYFPNVRGPHWTLSRAGCGPRAACLRPLSSSYLVFKSSNNALLNQVVSYYYCKKVIFLSYLLSQQRQAKDRLKCSLIWQGRLCRTQHCKLARWHWPWVETLHPKDIEAKMRCLRHLG